MDWLSVFDEARPDRGASDVEVQHFVVSIAQPLSQAEIDEINRSQRNPFPEGDPLHAVYRSLDPSVWVLPKQALPPAYLAFLRYSNGGWFRSGDREFGFFGTAGPGGVRDMTLAYQVPQYMSGALPFAFNGAGTFYLFDMRTEPVRDEYPIVCAHAGNLGWDSDACYLVADSFEAACRGRVDIDTLRWRT